MTNEKNKTTKQPEVPLQIITKNGTKIFIYDDGSVKVFTVHDESLDDVDDSSNPDGPPPPSPGH